MRGVAGDLHLLCGRERNGVHHPCSYGTSGMQHKPSGGLCAMERVESILHHVQSRQNRTSGRIATLGLEFQDVVILLSMPTLYVGVLVLLPIVESLFDKHRESIPFSCGVAITILALFIGYLAEWNMDFKIALDNVADLFPLISIALAGGSTTLAVYFRPFLIEVIFAALIYTSEKPHPWLWRIADCCWEPHRRNRPGCVSLAASIAKRIYTTIRYFQCSPPYAEGRGAILNCQTQRISKPSMCSIC